MVYFDPTTIIMPRQRFVSKSGFVNGIPFAIAIAIAIAQKNQKTEIHFTSLHYITLHHYIITSLHYTTLHYITLHYITLHYITLHYTTPHFTSLLDNLLQFTTGSKDCLQFMINRKSTQMRHRV